MTATTITNEEMSALMDAGIAACKTKKGLAKALGVTQKELNEWIHNPSACSAECVRTLEALRDEPEPPEDEEAGASKPTGKAPGEPVQKWDRGKLRLSAKLTGVSIGETTAAVGFKFSRDLLKVEIADDMLTDARLEVSIGTGDPDQNEMFPRGADKIKSVGDCHGMSVKKGTISARLTFRDQDVDLTALSRLATKEVTMFLERVGTAGDEPAEDEPGQGEIDFEADAGDAA